MHAYRTARLTRCQAHLTDVESLVRLFGQEPVYRYVCDGEPPAPTMIRSWIEKSEAMISAHGVGLFVARKDSDTVGLTGFFEFHDPPVIEFLFAVEPKLEGHGYAHEMGQTMLPLGLLHLERVYASTDAPNERSIRALRRLGFRETSRAVHPGGRYETVHFELPQPKRPASADS